MKGRASGGRKTGATRRTARVGSDRALRGLSLEIKALRITLDALIGQTGLTMETLMLMRAEQQRLADKLGLPRTAGGPDVTPCTEPDDITTVDEKPYRLTGGQARLRWGRAGKD
jgi:hypothetical protein